MVGMRRVDGVRVLSPALVSCAHMDLEIVVAHKSIWAVENWAYDVALGIIAV